MSVAYILAIMLMANPDSAPQAIAPFPTREQCMNAARESTKQDDRLRIPQAAAMQVEYVCLKVIRITT